MKIRYLTKFYPTEFCVFLYKQKPGDFFVLQTQAPFNFCGWNRRLGKNKNRVAIVKLIAVFYQAGKRGFALEDEK